MVKTSAQNQAAYESRKRTADPEAYMAENRAKKARSRAKKKAERDVLEPDGPMRASLAKEYVGTFQKIMDDARTAGEGKGPGAVAVPVARAVHKVAREVVAHANCVETQRLIVEEGARVAAEYAEKGQVTPKMLRASARTVKQNHDRAMRVYEILRENGRGGDPGFEKSKKEMVCNSFTWMQDVEKNVTLLKQYAAREGIAEGTVVTWIAGLQGWVKWFHLQDLREAYNRHSSPAAAAIALGARDNVLKNSEMHYVGWDTILAAKKNLAPGSAERFVVDLFTLAPPRRREPYAVMRAHRVGGKVNVATFDVNTLDKTVNWYIYGGRARGKPKFCFNVFKLATDFGGRQVIDVTPALDAAIKKWISAQGIPQDGWLLPAARGDGPMGANAFGTLLTNATKTMLDIPKGFSANGYRHAFASYVLSQPLPQDKVDEYAQAVGELKGETFRSYFRVGLNDK